MVELPSARFWGRNHRVQAPYRDGGNPLTCTARHTRMVLACQSHASQPPSPCTRTPLGSGPLSPSKEVFWTNRISTVPCTGGSTPLGAAASCASALPSKIKRQSKGEGPDKYARMREATLTTRAASPPSPAPSPHPRTSAATRAPDDDIQVNRRTHVPTKWIRGLSTAQRLR